MAPPTSDVSAAVDNGGGVLLVLLTLLWAPTGIIITSFLGLLQFKLLYSTFTMLAMNRKGGFVWKKIQPVLSDFVGSLEGSIGPASKWSPNLTQILLVGVALTVLLASERNRIGSGTRSSSSGLKKR